MSSCAPVCGYVHVSCVYILRQMSGLEGTYNIICGGVLEVCRGVLVVCGCMFVPEVVYKVHTTNFQWQHNALCKILWHLWGSGRDV